MSTNLIISKAWSFCNTLRDDGVGYGDYLEQLPYLLFLKRADEYTAAVQPSINIPTAHTWKASAFTLSGAGRELYPCTPGAGSRESLRSPRQ